jgi:hypothetical protein
MKPKNTDNKPLPTYIQPKVYFLMIRTIDQIKKVYPIPYKYNNPDFIKFKNKRK